MTRRLLRNPLGTGALLMLAVILLTSILAPWLSPHDPTRADVNAILAPSGDRHLLGGDGAGRDVLSRLVHGGRASLIAAALATGVAAAAGVPAGLVAGYIGGKVDAVSSWIADGVMSMPGIVLLLAVVAAVGSSTTTTMTAFGLLVAPAFYRLVRAAVRGVRSELYIDAARVSGLSDPRIIRRHIVRVVRAPVIIQASFVTGVAVVVQAGLQFLGLGDPETATWGAMLNDAFANIHGRPSLIFWPGLAIGLTVGSFAVLGTALRDALEERAAPAAPARRRRVGRSGPSATVRPPDPDCLIEVEGLRVSYPTPAGTRAVLQGVDLSLRRGEVLGLVGESGSGKTQTAWAFLGLLPREAVVECDRATVCGTAVDLRSPAAVRPLLGRAIGYVPQEPMSNLDPSQRIGAQLTEPLRHHLGLSRATARDRALELLRDVGIAEPARVYAAYPHEISGGMAQRVLIAGAISCGPEILVADEPTTALDVTVQAEVLDLLRRLQRTRGLTVVLVTHDLGVVADLCSRVAVMREGRIVETATVRDLFERPQDPYTRSLLEGVRVDRPVRRYPGAAEQPQELR